MVSRRRPRRDRRPDHPSPTTSTTTRCRADQDLRRCWAAAPPAVPTWGAGRDGPSLLDSPTRGAGLSHSGLRGGRTGPDRESSVHGPYGTRPFGSQHRPRLAPRLVQAPKIGKPGAWRGPDGVGSSHCTIERGAMRTMNLHQGSGPSKRTSPTTRPEERSKVRPGQGQCHRTPSTRRRKVRILTN